MKILFRQASFFVDLKKFSLFPGCLIPGRARQEKCHTISPEGIFRPGSRPDGQIRCHQLPAAGQLTVVHHGGLHAVMKQGGGRCPVFPVKAKDCDGLVGRPRRIPAQPDALHRVHIPIDIDITLHPPNSQPNQPHPLCRLLRRAPAFNFLSSFIISPHAPDRSFLQRCHTEKENATFLPNLCRNEKGGGMEYSNASLRVSGFRSVCFAGSPTLQRFDSLMCNISSTSDRAIYFTIRI